jgi:hypothetical protein
MKDNKKCKVGHFLNFHSKRFFINKFKLKNSYKLEQKNKLFYIEYIIKI